MSYDQEGPEPPAAVLSPAQEELVVLEASAWMATPGPWHVTGTNSVRDANKQTVAVTWAPELGDLDAVFIAAASPDRILSLCKRVREAELRAETAERKLLGMESK